MSAGMNLPDSGPDTGRSLEQALDALEQGLQSAVQAIGQIRAALLTPVEALAQVHEAPALRVVAPTTEETPPQDAPPLRVATPTTEKALPQDQDAPPLRDRDDDPYTPFERLWERMEHERLEKSRLDAEGEPQRKGLELLPQLYMVTVEDRERRVDLVPLHRALLGIEGIDEIALASYANGVPVVSLRAKHAIDLEQLRDAVEATLRRSCELIPQDTGRIFLRLTSPERIGV